MTEEKISANALAPSITLRDLSGMGIDLRGVRRLSKRFLGVIPAMELLSGVQLESVVEVDLCITLEEKSCLQHDLAQHDLPESEVALLRVQGRVSCDVRQECARCLDGFLTRLGVDVERVFVLGPDPAEVSSQQKMLGDFTYLPDFYLAVDHVAEEEVLLALPMIPLCQPECAGLCAGCGVDLNREKCLCAEKIPEGPFSVLSKFVVQ